jgi:hypothetical protein
MMVLDYDLVNAIQEERRAQADSERAANAMRRATPPQNANAMKSSQSALEWLRSSMPGWARVVFAR